MLSTIIFFSVFCLLNCQDFSKCGRTKESTSRRVHDAGAGEFPFMCSLSQSHDGFNVFIGGGSLVAPDKILTLGSAVKDYVVSEGSCLGDIIPAFDLFVACGSINLLDPKEDGEQIRRVTGVLLHPEFDELSLINDVAVLLMDRPFDLTESVGTVCLPEPGAQVQVNTTCEAAGHGKDYEGDDGYFASELKKVSLPIWSSEECEETLNENHFQPNHSITWNIHESFLCAGGEESYDTCEGDGGGPLVCPANSLRIRQPSNVGDNQDFGDDLDLRASSDQTDSSLVQVGVTAWGIGCGNPGLPSVYSSLSAPAVRCWLDQIISCYQPSEGSEVELDLRTENLADPETSGGLSEDQCGVWLDSESAKISACGCRQKLLLKKAETPETPETPDTDDLDLRDSFDLRQETEEI